jgi:hypothetical protein
MGTGPSKQLLSEHLVTFEGDAHGYLHLRSFQHPISRGLRTVLLELARSDPINGVLFIELVFGEAPVLRGR